MHRVVRLVTHADVHEDADVGGTSVSARVDARGWTEAPRGAGGDAGPHRISVSARHEAVLEDGSRVHLRSSKVRLEITRQLQERLENLLGPGNLKLLTTKPRPAQNAGPPRRQFQRVGS